MKELLKNLLIPQPKSKVKAGDGADSGKYKFFTCSPIQSKYYNEAQFDKPSLIFGTGGNASVHYCEDAFSTSTDCLVMYGKDGVNLELIYQYLYSYIQILQQGFKGAGLQHISKDYILNIEIDLPNAETQRRIAEQMRRIDILCKYRKSQLSFLEQLVKSRFIELFGDPVSNTMGWDLIPLGKRCDVITGNTPPRADAGNYGEYIEWIKSDNINTPNTYITEAEEQLSEKGFEVCRFVETGSLLMTCIAGSINCIGNVAVTDRRVAFNQQINAIVPTIDKVLYLYWLIQLSKPAIHSTINKALKGILSKGQLSEMRFPFPPIALQEQFAAFVERTDKSKYYSSLSYTYCQQAAKFFRQEWMTCQISTF